MVITSLIPHRHHRPNSPEPRHPPLATISLMSSSCCSIGTISVIVASSRSITILDHPDNLAIPSDGTVPVLIL